MKSDVYEKPVVKTYKEGVVSNCTLLNLRKEPNDSADVCAILPENTVVVVDSDFETDSYYRVIVKSMTRKTNYNFNRDYHGYCMKKFIKV